MIETAINPVTRGSVKLEPPLEAERAAEFWPKFDEFCNKAWEGPHRRSPVQANPYRILDGTELPSPLRGALYRLAQEYGYWAVAEELKKYEPGGGV